MRPLPRLIEVLQSCNHSIRYGFLLAIVGRRLEDKDAGGVHCIQICNIVCRHSRSPHYRELAHEALHYLTEKEK